jgi:hypothetical protein
MSLSAKQVVQIEHKRTNSKKEYYKALLEQFCRKIKVAVELGNRDAILTVPTFLVGYPKYDMAQTVLYMSRQLQRLGYIVNLVGPFNMRVQWNKAVKFETEIEREEIDPITYMPSLANLKKTAEKIRVSKKK